MSSHDQLSAKDEAPLARGREAAPPEAGRAERMAQRAVYVPAVDITETADAIHLAANLPGGDRAGVDIMLEKRTLTIKATGRAGPPEGYSPLHLEYESGDFERSFTVSDEIDAAAISATVRDGVLSLVLPKRAPDKRRIEVGA